MSTSTTPSDAPAVSALPPDAEGLNGRRATAARRTLDAFARDFGESGSNSAMLRQNAQDLLCNLAHLFDREGFSYADILRVARAQYKAETDGRGSQMSTLSFGPIAWPAIPHAAPNSVTPVPVLYVLDNAGEATNVHWFCTTRCRDSYLSNEKVAPGESSDWIEGTQCETCGKDVA